MTSTTDAVSDLLGEAAKALGAHALDRPPADPGGADLAALAPADIEAIVRRYYAHVAADDLVDRTPAELGTAVASHFLAAASRPQGTAAIRVRTPAAPAAPERPSRGARPPLDDTRSVVEIVTDDMPFLVDSATIELHRNDIAIHLTVHPQMSVRRDVAGRLLEVLGTGERPEGCTAESWMHIEIDRVAEEGQAALEANLQRVLRDVREAVEDWPKISAAARRIADDLMTAPPGCIPQEDVTEATELLRWLAQDHFTFLGFREYRLVVEEEEPVLQAIPGSGLGILRADQQRSISFGSLPSAVKAKAREAQLLILTKANSRSTVHRPAYLDYVGVKVFDADGNAIGERRFLGLFTSAAYTDSVQRIPLLRRKVQQVLARSGFAPNSHGGKDLVEILETYPRDELFQIPVEELEPIATSVLHLQERRQLRVFLRKDVYGRFLSCIVYLPRDRYTTDVRRTMADILTELTEADSVDYTARVSESVLARLHFVARMPRGKAIPEIDSATLEERFGLATRVWEDDLLDKARAHFGSEEAARLLAAHPHGFPEAYKADFSPNDAVEDIEELAALGPDGIAVRFYESLGRADKPRFKIYRTGTPLSLSEILPVLQQMGVEVVDERPYELGRRGEDDLLVYDFGLRYVGGGNDPRMLGEHDISNLVARFQDGFIATWRGEAESDGFNALVASAGLTWRRAMILRAYAKYLRQAGSTFSQDYLEESLQANVHIARLLVDIFETRFDPDLDGDRAAASERLAQEIGAALDDVASLDQDRILRSFLTLIRATLRTSYYQRNADGSPKPYVSFKFDPRQIPDLPAPRPRFEIWSYSPDVEGVHLRFGPVARGGLRWSDRREDFRTEVLGLVKAQAVKNAVIVPVGAKGGFVVKRAVDPTDREAWLSAGIACYRRFITSMLDITDNLVDGVVVPPERVVRHDGDDTYLVVAADKGTATFSDIANAVAAEYDFWLGDAFASGGSAGYDHKAMGITARGAWESVKRHFREMGRNCQTEDFTVVGVGDMSGDVFGNGMLLSDHIRLVAAFDHRHIFLDPDPDAATSFAERLRLFDLPRSSWQDYDSALISAGGGVFLRTAKSVPVSAEARAALGISGDTAALSPAELMRAIVKAPVDLFWNGGIGTYIKAESETNADVGDKANDAIRINGADLRAEVVGEGGNLGCTQRGRIEYALKGGRINTDAIDNSAGVDTSDHEVNIKILLDRVVATRELSYDERNALLAEMTDEVGQLVLADNYGQNVSIASGILQAPALLHVHRAYIRGLVKRGQLDRDLEFLPSDRQIAERTQAGLGLTAPEYAVLLAYTKMTLAEQIIETDLPDDPFLATELHDYFPTALRERYRAEMESHRLRREIIVTQVVNNVVNNAGVTFHYRLNEETGASVEDLLRAHIAAQAIFDLNGIWAAVDALDNIVAAEVQTKMRLEGRTIAERTSRWLVNNRRPPISIAAAIERLHHGVAQVVSALPELLVGREATLFTERRDRLLAAGVSAELAVRVATLSPAYGALGIVETSRRMDIDPLTVARVHYRLGERLQLGRLLERVIALPRHDRWESMVRAALRDDLHATHAALTAQVLACTPDEEDAIGRVTQWEEQSGVLLQRARSMLADVIDGDTWDLARLSVGLRVVRTLVEAPTT